MPKDKIVLAYSGGLDTSVAIHWLREKYNAEVVTLTIDLGMVDLENIRRRALETGAANALTVDGKDGFVVEYVYPALKAGAIYEEKYHLATALGRPLIAHHLAQVARKEGAYAVAHGCTGKGNDQVRLDVSIGALAPELKVIAPIREWAMSREEEMEYAREHNIPVPWSKKLYSIDENLWGRSIESGDLEDPWNEPPEGAFAWTNSINDAPADPIYIEIEFKQGLPVAIDGEEMRATDLIRHLNHLAGQQGVGRVDHVENRLVGIKSREVYEAPAATVFHSAHKAIETITLGKEQIRLKSRIAQEYADIVYNGLWFTSHRRDLDAYVHSTQRNVSGTARVKLHKGNCVVVGTKSPNSLYSHGLATYDKGDKFDHKSAEGFIALYGLPARTEGQLQDDADANQPS